MIKSLAALFFLLIFIAGCNSSLSNFKEGYKEIKAVDEAYAVSLSEYPINFADINLTTPIDMETATMMQKDFTGLKGKFENQKNRNGALLAYLDFRIKFLDAEIYYKSKLLIGAEGEIKDGFGCKHKPTIIESADYANMSAHSGYTAVFYLDKFLEEYPREASLAEVSGTWPMLMNTSFHQIEKDAISAKSLINKVC